jgi:hypothetical protein
MSPEILRALCSLPLRARLEDDFHRRFIAGADPGLLPSHQPAAAPTSGPRFAERLVTAAWLSEHVLGSPLIIGELGRAWCERVRQGLAQSDSHAFRLALQASGPVLLAEALEDLA